MGSELMDWKAPFVVFRIVPGGTFEQVYSAPDFKSAKYWLTYIAKPGDVLCKTPLHPKHSRAGSAPEYWGHKEESGLSAVNEQAWKDYARKMNCEPNFPDRPGA